MTSIGESAFSGCNNITSISFPSTISEAYRIGIEDTPWYINQPDGVVYIGSVAYKYKSTMPENTSIAIKEGTVSIGVSAFYECSNLISISIPSSVRKIGDQAFFNCVNIKSVNITDLDAWCNIQIGSDNYYDSTNPLYYSKHLYLNNVEVTKVVFPEGIKNISHHIFVNCNLNSVIIPNSVTSIGQYAFSGCKLEKVILKSLHLANQHTIMLLSMYLWGQNGI